MKKIVVLSTVLALTGCNHLTQPITENKQYTNTLGGLKNILDSQEKISGQLTLSEAVARTLKYNLDHRVAIAQNALESSNFNLAMMQLLPKFNTKMDYSFRDNLLIQNLLQNGQIVPGQTSTTPRFIIQNGYQLQWSALDISLSYISTKQQSKRALIAEEQRRKISQQLLQEATTAYWQAFIAQRLSYKVSKYKQNAKIALQRSKDITASQDRSNQVELDYQQMLIKSIRKANGLQREIAHAKVELSRLMNVHPQAQYTLKEPSFKLQALPSIKRKLIEMDTIALVARPELREASYNKLIRKHGIEAALMSIFPELNFDYGWNHTNNIFMRNPTWMGGNINLTWNLLKTFLLGPQEIKSAKLAHELEKLKQAATTISVLTQIRVALTNYYLSREDYHFAHEEFKVTRDLMRHAYNLQQANQGNEQETIRRELDKLNSEFDNGITHAKAQASLFTLYQSVGIDLVPHQATYLPLKDLTNVIHKVLTDTANGGFNKVIDNKYQALLPKLDSPNVEVVGKDLNGKNIYKVIKPIKLADAGLNKLLTKLVKSPPA